MCGEHTACLSFSAALAAFQAAWSASTVSNTFFGFSASSASLFFLSSCPSTGRKVTREIRIAPDEGKISWGLGLPAP